MSWTRPRRCFSLYALVVGRLNIHFFFFFFFLSTNSPSALLLREESSLICYLTVGSKQVHKHTENRFADPARLTKKKSSGSGYVLEIARSPFGIFSSNDKKPSPSEELGESTEVQESKGKTIFSSVVKQANIAILKKITFRHKASSDLMRGPESE